MVMYHQVMEEELERVRSAALANNGYDDEYGMLQRQGTLMISSRSIEETGDKTIFLIETGEE